MWRWSCCVCVHKSVDITSVLTGARRTRYKLCMVTQVCGTTITCTRRRIVPRGDRVVDRKAQCERRNKKPLREGSFQSTTHFLYPNSFHKEKTFEQVTRLTPGDIVGLRKCPSKTCGRSGETSHRVCLPFHSPSIAHAQGTVDFSGATTAMNSFKTFAEYAGAVICFGCLIWAGIRLMSGRFQDAIPGLFGALFGAGVLGWGAGWISSLTGQSVTQ